MAARLEERKISLLSPGQGNLVNKYLITTIHFYLLYHFLPADEWMNRYNFLSTLLSVMFF